MRRMSRCAYGKIHREEGSRELLESLARILGEEAKAA